MSVTFETSHFDMSPLNDSPPMKMALMSVILDTSHSPIGPCSPSEQSSSTESRRVMTALLSSFWECGENTDSSPNPWPAQKSGETKIRRAMKTTWVYMATTHVGSWLCFCVSACGFTSTCVHLYQCKSARLACVQSQHCEAMPYASRKTPGTRHCSSMVMRSIKIVTFGVKVRWRRVNTTSDLAARGCLYFARMPRLVMGVSESLHSHWR